MMRTSVPALLSNLSSSRNKKDDDNNDYDTLEIQHNDPAADENDILNNPSNHDDENALNGNLDDAENEWDDLAFCVVWSPLPPITWFIPVIGHLGICDSRGVASDFRGPYYVGDDGRMAFGAPTRAVAFAPPPSSSPPTPNHHPHNNNTNNNNNEDVAENYTRLWDRSVQEANAVYMGRMHNICCDNCHSHVANALNRMTSKWATSSSSSSTNPDSSNGNSLRANNNKRMRQRNVRTTSCSRRWSTASIEHRTHWDMVKLAFLVFFKGRFLSWYAVYAQFGPFAITMILIFTMQHTTQK